MLVHPTYYILRHSFWQTPKDEDVNDDDDFSSLFIIIYYIKMWRDFSFFSEKGLHTSIELKVKDLHDSFWYMCDVFHSSNFKNGSW